MINLLLQEPNIDLNLTTFHNYTALNLACWLNKPSIVRQLFKVPGIDPNLPNDFGRSPLLEAYFHKHQDFAKELLDMVEVNLPESFWKIRPRFREGGERRRQHRLKSPGGSTHEEKGYRKAAKGERKRRIELDCRGRKYQF